MPLTRWSYLSQVIVQRLSLALLLALAAAASLWSISAAVGLAPWLQLPVGLGGAAPVDAGTASQLSLTALLLGLCFFVPSHDRVMRLETSHRDFRVTMWDVAQAYQAAHAADREGVFSLPSEFDSVRERIEHLRRHPVLAILLDHQRQQVARHDDRLAQRPPALPDDGERNDGSDDEKPDRPTGGLDDSEHAQYSRKWP